MIKVKPNTCYRDYKGRKIYIAIGDAYSGAYPFRGKTDVKNSTYNNSYSIVGGPVTEEEYILKELYY